MDTSDEPTAPAEVRWETRIARAERQAHEQATAEPDYDPVKHGAIIPMTPPYEEEPDGER